jgi:RNA polymerase sigma-70 factor (ECF subfamily)
MEEKLETSFARYRSSGDPRELAKVFDATAPRLLRVAIHFAGDVGAAEDLVQATFVTAIERAQAFDASLALEPWLTGILVHHARALRREALRVPDIRRLIERTQSTPPDEAIAAELSGTIAAALDELDEPYRQTLILRLRHGMKSADIAHVLGESPSAVRVRIHRGLDRLRKLLPAGVALGGIFAIDSARGLDAVRQSVLAHAATKAAVVSSLVIGGVVVGKKLALVAAALVLVFAAWWAKNREFAKEPAIVGTDVTIAANPAPTAVSEAVSISSPAGVAEDTRAALPSALAADLVPLRGKVLDGETGEPVAGARVQLFAPRSTKLLALQRRWSDRMHQGATTSIWSDDTYPWCRAELSDLARADAEAFTVYDPPLPGAAPIAAMSSQADGTFELPASAEWGFLVCEASGFEKREMSARRNETLHRMVKNESKDFEVQHDSVVVRLWKRRPLAGFVIDPRGELVRRRTKLCFIGRRIGEDASTTDVFDPSACGSWIVETDDNGAFKTELASQWVSARCVDPGWCLDNEGIHPVRKEAWVFKTSFEPGRESEPAWLVVRRVSVLAVTDAETHRPIESIQIVIRERGDSYPERAGKFLAPGGRLTLASEPIYFTGYGREQWQRPHHLTVWADGHSAVEIDVVDAFEGPDVSVELRSGELPIVRGTVRSSGVPVEGCTVSVLAFSHMTWYPDERFLVDAARSARDGAFEFRLPAGEYLLRCTLGDVVQCRTFQAPTLDLHVDLSSGGSITAHMFESDGAPRSAHSISLHGADGRSQGGVTNEKGELAFLHLAPGKYSVFTSFGRGRRSSRTDAEETIELADNESRSVDFRAPISVPKHARVVLNNGASAEGLRARDGSGASKEWMPVAPDGTVPIDIQLGVRMIEVEEHPTSRWTFTIPNDPPDGVPLRISRDARGYRGVLLDASDDHPLGGVGLLAVHRGADNDASTCIACLTDSEGRFELGGLEESSYELSLRNDPSDRLWWDRSLGVVSFLPLKPPSDPPTEISIRAPRLNRDRSIDAGKITLYGKIHIHSEATFHPSVRVMSFVDSSEGTLRLFPSSCASDMDADGSYRVVIPKASRYRATFYDWQSRHEFPAQEWTSTSDDAAQMRDFDLQ